MQKTRGYLLILEFAYKIGYFVSQLTEKNQSLKRMIFGNKNLIKKRNIPRPYIFCLGRCLPIPQHTHGVFTNETV